MESLLEHGRAKEARGHCVHSSFGGRWVEGGGGRDAGEAAIRAAAAGVAGRTVDSDIFTISHLQVHELERIFHEQHT